MTRVESTPATDLTLSVPSVDRSPAVDDAVVAANVAAAAAGIQIRQLTQLADFTAVYRLYAEIWGPMAQNPPVPVGMLRALAKANNYVCGAFDGDELVGASVAFFAGSVDVAMHSHIAGVSARMRGRNVGFALKVHQRAWAMLRGVSTISWTFDPLVCRNAHFNFSKLAAVSGEYLPNFYGDMDDTINGRDATDRLLVTWHLDDDEVRSACSRNHRGADAEAARAQGASIGLSVSDSGTPVPGQVDAARVLIAIPDDIERLRATDAARAGLWRKAVREVLGELLANGGRITGFDRAGWYIVDKEAAR
ncbi:GNAT family N-acetyltransferase [Streptomyces mirabilis]|uniref:GNAT family N-acetyltransferase n=1 Tax=Streptomyces mirabilis TaxID=68239 RepID=UPI00382B6363